MAVILEDYKYDAERCMRCSGCKWIDHIYVPGMDFSYRCPSIARYQFDTYAAHGRLRLAAALMEGRLTYSPRFIDAIYKCTLCGGCDVGCKRNLDLEPLLVLEGLRARCVQDGQGPLPEHKKVAENILHQHNRYGASHQKRLDWAGSAIKPAATSKIAYFVGCGSSYVHPEIAQATARLLAAAGTQFMVLGGEEWCCGYPLYSTGQVDAARTQMEHNLEAIKKSGADTILVSCAQCYKTLKVDYPKLMGKSTTDLEFKVVHVVEYIDKLIEEGILKLSNKVDMKITYHDPCNLARLSEPWIHWEGKRVDWGCLEPPKEFRRGTYGIYESPRNILHSVPGIELVEMARRKENAWCCGAGGGVRDAFHDFALWTAGERLDEVKSTMAEAIVSCCPHCKTNFQEAIDLRKEKLRVYDITEIVLKAISE